MKYLICLLMVLVLTAGAAAPASAQGWCEQCDFSWGVWTCLITLPSGYESCFSMGWGCDHTGSCGGGGTCFLEGVMINSLGGLVAIQDLKVGDEVLSWDPDGPNNPATVTAVYKHEGKGYLLINDTIPVTVEHPFYINKEWVNAGNLKVGDVLEGINGNAVTVKTIVAIDKGVRVFNISVDGTHTYFANDILVHNKGPVPQD